MKTKFPMLLAIVGVLSTPLPAAHSTAAPAPASAGQSSLGRPAAPESYDVTPPGSLFFDDFSSATNSALSAPWQATQTNTWTLAEGALRASAQEQTYSFAYLTNSWKNYAIEARICFSTTNAYGGGIGGRLNPVTGSQYAVWVYPEGSPGGSNLLKLVKFQNWTTFGYGGTNSVPMQQVSLEAVGTNWHSLKLVFLTNQITVAYDGTPVISLADREPLPYLSGAIGLGMWTDQTPFAMSLEEVAVSAVAPPPVALNDGYWLAQNQALVVPAPGILQNDGAGAGTNLTASLATGPLHGMLTLNSNGGFSYTPAVGFVGTDSFSYRAGDDQTNSTPATVTLLVSPTGTSFHDDFSRTTTPELLPPWIAHSGNWTVTEGLLQGGTNLPESYAFTYLPANWTNYEVEATFRFSGSNAWGGGIGGRLNPATGAHYAAWVYPEDSAGGSNVVRLIKFQDWEHFGYTNLDALPMRQVTVNSVGTNWHTLKLAFQADQITVSYDGQPVIGMADQEPSPYTTGAVALETWSDLEPYSFFVQSVTVKPVAGSDSYATIHQTLSVSSDLATLRWNTVAGQNYQIQYKDELNQTNWSVLQPIVTATQTTLSITNSVTQSRQRFFRVVHLP